MQLTTEKRDVVKSQEFETLQYGVSTENLALLFKLLRTNLYSDLHGSIIRELVSNVIDSHTEAGKPETLGEVEWINSARLLGVDCELIVRDFGVGLSPERMKDVYANYLSSTKRGSNTEIGGFGLGSKVPFAYTDSFSVQTIYDGIKYRYLCYIDESELGAIALFGTPEPTQDGNRTEIIIPIKDEHNDKPIFQDAINQQLAYFTTIKYINFDAPDPEITFENDHCIIKRVAPKEALHIVLGNVAYDIDFKALGATEEEIREGGFLNCGVGLKFGIGELQPTMSREKLFWSPASKAKVSAKIEKARKTIQKAIGEELKKETDYAKWYGAVMAEQTDSFPRQFQFAAVKKSTLFSNDRSEIFKATNKMEDWFSGHNVRAVFPKGLNRRRSSSGSDVYDAVTADFSDLQELKAFKLERNLNGDTCNFIFSMFPKGFLAVSHLVPPAEKDLLPYYNQTMRWRDKLESFDDLDVPEGEGTGAANGYRNERYRALIAARKLEGKFTAKTLYPAWCGGNDLEKNYQYNMYEGKFQDHKNSLIIYGYQTEHKKLCQIASMITMSDDLGKRFKDKWDYKTSGYIPKPIFFFKIAQSYEKQFFAMKNAWHVDEVLKLEGPWEEILGSIATALRMKPFIHQYHALEYFEFINVDMRNRYQEVHKFVEQHAVHDSNFTTPDVHKLVLQVTEDHLNKELEGEWQKIQDYFNGADLLKCVNFDMYSTEHGRQDRTKEGTTANYLRRWVIKNQPFILDYLNIKGKQVDGGPVVPELSAPLAVLAKEPDEVILKVSEELSEQREEQSSLIYELNNLD